MENKNQVQPFSKNGSEKFLKLSSCACV